MINESLNNEIFLQLLLRSAIYLSMLVTLKNIDNRLKKSNDAYLNFVCDCRLYLQVCR